MAQPTEDLADFVRRIRLERRLSTRDVGRRSAGEISYGYVSQIENRTVLGSGVSPGRLMALARGLGIPDDEIFAIARGRRLSEPEARQIRAMIFFDSLPEERQEDALAFLEALSRRHGIRTESIAAAKKRLKSRRAA